jgi:signal transduction histidine kinase
MTEAIGVLIIDDSEDDRALYRRTLAKSRESTYEIAEAEDGETGLARLAEQSPDCVLLDYSLPGRNGVEVLKRLRAKHPFIPVVMLTGQGSETVAVTAMQEGAQNYISKATITPEALQRAIRVAIEHCAMERRIHEQRSSLEIFTRALAHDLKEPVRTIKSFLSVISSHETLTERGQGYFNYIQSAADRMEALIDAVYFYTRLDGGKQELSKEVCDVAAVLKDAKADVSTLIRERKAIVVGDALPHVVANRRQLMQVLQNLLCNAIQHCTEAPLIRVTATEEPDRWLIRVADNGPGIEEAQREKIFEPFKRLAQSNAQGLGLGLAICKRIVELHGEKIWCEAAPDRGAVFVFSLSKDAVAGVATEQAKSTDETPAGVAEREQKALANLLLVDDNEADIELARIMLLEESKLRCNLLTARDAYVAMEILRNNTGEASMVDLLLLDINMPGMDGFELLEAMRAVESLRDVPVLICSTSGYDKDMERAKALGAIGYLAKPAELDKLKPFLERIGRLCLFRDDQGHMLLRAAARTGASTSRGQGSA